MILFEFYFDYHLLPQQAFKQNTRRIQKAQAHRKRKLPMHKHNEYILFQYFTYTQSERGLAITKQGFRAAGVQGIKAVFRQLILTEAL